MPDFIEPKDLPSTSPDLNPFEYKLWSILEVKVWHKWNSYLKTLKNLLRKAATVISMERVCVSTDGRLKNVKNESFWIKDVIC